MKMPPPPLKDKVDTLKQNVEYAKKVSDLLDQLDLNRKQRSEVITLLYAIEQQGSYYFSRDFGS